MTSLPRSSAASKSTAAAVEAFVDELRALGYNPTITAEAAAYVRAHGTTAGMVELGLLDPEDAESATEAFVGGFATVPPGDRAWDVPAARWEPCRDVMASGFESEPYRIEAECDEARTSRR